VLTGALCIALALSLLWFAVSMRRLRREIRTLLGAKPQKPQPTQHLSPHRRRVDEKRRINR